MQEAEGREGVVAGVVAGGGVVADVVGAAGGGAARPAHLHFGCAEATKKKLGQRSKPGKSFNNDPNQIKSTEKERKMWAHKKYIDPAPTLK